MGRVGKVGGTFLKTRAGCPTFYDRFLSHFSLRSRDRFPSNFFYSRDIELKFGVNFFWSFWTSRFISEPLSFTFASKILHVPGNDCPAPTFFWKKVMSSDFQCFFCLILIRSFPGSFASGTISGEGGTHCTFCPSGENLVIQRQFILSSDRVGKLTYR